MRKGLGVADVGIPGKKKKKGLSIYEKVSLTLGGNCVARGKGTHSGEDSRAWEEAHGEATIWRGTRTPTAASNWASYANAHLEVNKAPIS